MIDTIKIYSEINKKTYDKINSKFEYGEKI